MSAVIQIQPPLHQQPPSPPTLTQPIRGVPLVTSNLDVARSPGLAPPTQGFLSSPQLDGQDLVSPNVVFPDAFPLEWSDIMFTVKNKDGSNKHILDHVWGKAPTGQLTAIMGPSGCGKTSLLNILAGRVQPTSGSIGINKICHRKLVGYVPQEDHLLGFLTVRESIRFATKLRTVLNDHDTDKLVRETLQFLGLTGVGDVKIGSAVVRGISGGQKRRVSIAEEFVGRRPIILLDEPTSGLDSSAAYHILQQLRELAASRQLTIILTIHQPSSETFSLIDNLILLASGRLIYSGPRVGAADFFTSVGKPVPPMTNPSDHFLMVLNADFAPDPAEAKRGIFAIADRFDKESPNKITVTTFHGPKCDFSDSRPGIIQQTIDITHRCWINASRNLVMYWIRVAMFLLMAILMGTVWLNLGLYQDTMQHRLNGHFFAVAFLCFMAVAGIPAFLEEALVFKREVQGKVYTPTSYVIATTLISIPFIFLTALVFSAISYPMINQGVINAGHYFTYLGVLFLSLFTAEGLTLALAAWTQTFVVALALSSFANGFFMVMIGYFVPFKSMPKFWIWGHYISYQKYSFEAMVKNDVATFVFNCMGPMPGETGCNCALRDALYPVCQFHGQAVIDWLDISKGSIIGWCFVLVAMSIVWRIIFAWGLLYHTSKFN